MIQINDEWRANWDGNQFTLERYRPGGEMVRNPATGEMQESKPQWMDQKRYFTSMEGVLTYIAKQVAGEQAQDLNQYVSILTTLWAQFRQLVEVPK